MWKLQLRTRKKMGISAVTIGVNNLIKIKTKANCNLKNFCLISIKCSIIHGTKQARKQISIRSSCMTERPRNPGWMMTRRRTPGTNNFPTLFF